MMAKHYPHLRRLGRYSVEPKSFSTDLRCAEWGVLRCRYTPRRPLICGDGFRPCHQISACSTRVDANDVTTSPPEPSLAWQTLFAESSRHRSTRRVAPPGSAVDCVRLPRPQRAGSLVERTVLEPVIPALPARRNALPGGADCATRSVGAAASRPNRPSAIHSCLI